MTDTGRSTDSFRPMARKVDVRRTGGSWRRVATVFCLAALGAVALIGALHPASVAGVQPTPSATLAATSAAGSVWGIGDSAGSIDWLGLITKGTVVLALLFITLRLLGRTSGDVKKRPGRLEVLESKTLAPKASLHLVAIGDRRLVVGLTPSGMVSLAELDAGELETDEAAASADADPAAAVAGPVGFASWFSGGSSPSALGKAMDSGLRFVDSVTGRLVLLLSGGRGR
jgi:flagellar biogenesis protein FliO